MAEHQWDIQADRLFTRVSGQQARAQGGGIRVRAAGGFAQGVAPRGFFAGLMAMILFGRGADHTQAVTQTEEHAAALTGWLDLHGQHQNQDQTCKAPHQPEQPLCSLKEDLSSTRPGQPKDFKAALTTMTDASGPVREFDTDPLHFTEPAGFFQIVIFLRL